MSLCHLHWIWVLVLLATCYGPTSNHHDTLLEKATSKLGLLMRTCHVTMNVKQEMKCYLSVIRSLFEHCSVIWRPISKNQIYQFDVIQKRAVKWINGRKFDHYSDEEFYENKRNSKFFSLN